MDGFNSTVKYLLFFQIIIATIILLLKNDFVRDIQNEIPLWSKENSKKEIKSRIEKEANLTNILAVINFIAIILGSTLYIIPLSDDIKLFFVLRLIENYLQDYYKTVAKVIIYSTYPFIGHILIAHVYQVIYYVQHIKFQVIIFKDHFTQISDHSQNYNDESLFYDESYQKKVTQRLKFCIKRLQEFIL